MRMIKTLGIVLASCCLLGCASNPAVRAYQAGAVTTAVVNEVHKEAWSEPLNEQITLCDTEDNDTKAKLLACMEPYTPDKNEQVIKALAAYNISMEVFGASVEQALKQSKDGKVDTKELLEDLKEIIRQAIEVLKLFPEGEKHAKRLEALTRGLL